MNESSDEAIQKSNDEMLDLISIWVYTSLLAKTFREIWILEWLLLFLIILSLKILQTK